MIEVTEPTLRDELRPGYKMTELGALPEEWQVVRLGDIASIRGETIDPVRRPDLRYVGLEHLTSGESQIRSWGSSEEVRSSKSLFYPGDLLYGKLRPYLDKAAVADWAGMVSTDVLVMVPREDVDPAYLGFLAHTAAFREHAVVTTTGVNHPRTSWQALRPLQLPLPPVREQRAIAHVLSTVQRARETTDAVIAATRELKKSLMRHLFTYGPMPVDEIDGVVLKETEIGRMPAVWELSTLDALIEDGPQNGLYKPQSLYGRGSPIVRIDDFGNEGEILHGARQQVELCRDEVEKYALRYGDILINRVNSLSHLGKVAFVGETFGSIVYESNMMRFSVSCSVIPQYVFRFLSSPHARDHLRGKAKRAVAQSSINQGDVASTPIPIPTVEEQHAVVGVFQVLDQKLAVEIARQRAIEAIFLSLLDSLMSASIRLPYQG